MHYEESGAFTGNHQKQVYVILGHSERRVFNETDETVNLKLKSAIKHDLKPIVCVGESLEIRENGTTDKVVEQQVIKAFKDISAEQAANTIVAYEPIWAIGTGKTASPAQAQETINAIRSVLTNLYGTDVSDKVRILYGGSVNPKNVDELLQQLDIDGIGWRCITDPMFLSTCKSK